MCVYVYMYMFKPVNPAAGFDLVIKKDSLPFVVEQLFRRSPRIKKAAGPARRAQGLCSLGIRLNPGTLVVVRRAI